MIYILVHWAVFRGYDNRTNEGRSGCWVEGASVLGVNCQRVN